MKLTGWPGNEFPKACDVIWDVICQGTLKERHPDGMCNEEPKEMNVAYS